MVTCPYGSVSIARSFPDSLWLLLKVKTEMKGTLWAFHVYDIVKVKMKERGTVGMAPTV